VAPFGGGRPGHMGERALEQEVGFPVSL